MGITILSQMDTASDDDVIARQKRAHAARVDEKDEFLKASVKVAYGIGQKTTHELQLRYPKNGTYIFAVYSDNLTLADKAGDDQWAVIAKDAIEKFCAMQGLNIKMGPRPEDHNRYNFMAEVQGVIR